MMSNGVILSIIQGDSYQRNIKIMGIDSSLIEEIYLSSSKLELKKKLTYNKCLQKWVFKLTPEETKNLKSISTDFDITIRCVSDDIFTVIYKGTIKVLPKSNEVWGD